MKQKKFRPKQLSFRAALLLFCLLLATLGMAVGLHARYTTGASASDGARVAKFEITEDGLGKVESIDTVITANLVPGETITKKLTIQNKSEVAVEYTIAVKNVTNNLPLEFGVSKGNVDTVDISAMSKDTTTGEFSCSAQLAPNEGKPNTYILEIIWPIKDSQNSEDDDYRSTEYMGKVDQVKVSISAIQID